MKKFKQGARATGGRSLYVIVSIEQSLDVAEKKLESYGELGILPRSLRERFKPFNCVHAATIVDDSILHHVYRVPIGERSVSYLRSIFESFGVSIYGHDGAKHKFGRVFYNSPNKNSHAPLHLPWKKISAEVRRLYAENANTLDKMSGLFGKKQERKLLKQLKERLPYVNFNIVPSALDILGALPIVAMFAPSLPENAINGITLRAATLLQECPITSAFLAIMSELSATEKYCADNYGKPEIDEIFPKYLALKTSFETCQEYLGKMLESEYQKDKEKFVPFECKEYENTYSDYEEVPAFNSGLMNLEVYGIFNYDYSIYRLRVALADESFSFD